MKNYWSKEVPEGAHQPATRTGGAALPPGRAPCPCGPLVALLPMPFGHKIPFTLEKITENYWDFPPPSARRNLGGALLLSGGAILPGKLPSGRGKSKPSSSPTLQSSWRSSSSSTSSPAPSHLKTLVHLLCSIFVSNLRLVPGGASSVDYTL